MPLTPLRYDYSRRANFGGSVVHTMLQFISQMAPMSIAQEVGSLGEGSVYIAVENWELAIHLFRYFYIITGF